MKLQNINNASVKTTSLIKKIFAEMLSEKQELGKISVSELCKRANISRGAFYSHYDDIYGVAEDYENELINTFFDNARLLSTTSYEQFTDVFFDYIRKNDGNYRLLCKSNDFIFAAKKLTTIAANKFMELCNTDGRIVNKEYLQIELSVFLEGLLCEYVKYCRNYTANTLDDLYVYSKYWLKNFVEKRTKKA